MTGNFEYTLSVNAYFTKNAQLCVEFFYMCIDKSTRVEIRKVMIRSKCGAFLILYLGYDILDVLFKRRIVHYHFFDDLY